MMQEQKRAADRERQRRWRAANIERRRQTDRARYRANPEPVRRSVAEDAERLRVAALTRYGTACACCGVLDDLTIDHVDGNGGQHRAELFGDPKRGAGVRFYRWLKNNEYPDGYQTLCGRCNRSKGNGRRCSLH